MRDFFSPLLLSTEVGLSSSGVIQANPTDLLNPNNTAMLIDQFRFSVQWTNTGTTNYYTPIFILSTSIQIGAVPLTNGLVPVMAICPTYDLSTEPTLVWHLPKPLYVPPNVTLYVNMALNPSYPGNYATDYIRVAVVGRSLPSDYPQPQEIYAPWASAAVFDKNSNQISTLAGRQILTSPDNALGNPNDTDLMVTRFVGFRSADITTSVTDYEGADTCTLKMNISNGKLLVREPTPWYHLFPNSRRFFDTRALLRGKNSVRTGGEFVRAQFSFQSFTYSSVDYTNIGTNYVGMIGYRKVPTPVGANG